MHMQFESTEKGTDDCTATIFFLLATFLSVCQILFEEMASTWLSPTRDPSRDPNLKWVSNRIPIACNKVPIWKTHFGCHEKYNPNLSITSSGDPFVKRVFLVLLLEKIKNERRTCCCSANLI